jgi:hypothetical protein
MALVWRRRQQRKERLTQLFGDQTNTVSNRTYQVPGLAAAMLDYEEIGFNSGSAEAYLTPVPGVGHIADDQATYAEVTPFDTQGGTLGYLDVDASGYQLPTRFGLEDASAVYGFPEDPSLETST